MSELDVKEIKDLFRISLDERLMSIQLVSAEPMVTESQKTRYILYTEPYSYWRFVGRVFESVEARIVDYILNIVRREKLYKEYNDDNLLDLLERIDQIWRGAVDGIKSEITKLSLRKLSSTSTYGIKYDPQVVWKGEVDKADFWAKYLGIPMEKDKPKAVDCCGFNSIPIYSTLGEQIDEIVKEAVQKEATNPLSKEWYISYPRKNGKSLYLDAMLEAMRKEECARKPYYYFTIPQHTWGYNTKNNSSYSAIIANAYSKETKNMKREFIREEKPQTFENIVREAYYYPSFFDLSALEPTDVFIKVDDELRTIYMVVEGENELKSKKTVLNIFTGKLEKMDNETKVHLFDIDEVKFVTGRFVTDTKKAEHEEV